jgi:glycosyl transferase family 25
MNTDDLQTKGEATFGLLNQFFDHIYVVTIARAAQRHTVLQRVLAGLDYELFMGADAALFSTEELASSGLYNEKQAIRNHRYGKPLAGGMLGCALSHRMVYEDLLIKGYKTALVLEDDVELAEQVDHLAQSLAELPENWGLLYFDYNKHERKPLVGNFIQIAYHVQRFFGAITYSHKAINNLYTRPYSQHWWKAGYHDYTDAYAVSRAGATTLLKLQTPVQWVADNLLAHACSNEMIEAFSLKEKLFYQTSQTIDKSTSLVKPE